MTEENGTVQTETVQEDDFYGFLRPCPHCKETVKAVKDLNLVAKTTLLLATVLDPNIETDNSRKNALVCGPYKVDCLKCHNSRVVLTLKGRRLLGIIKTWLEDASPDWMAETEEFPF